MAADVTLDADGLGRPAVFARRLPTPSRARLTRRATQIFRVGTRNFAPLIWKTARHRTLPDDEFAAPLRHTFEEPGGTFMKFGQLVGSASSMFGDAVAQEFRPCLDTGDANAGSLLQMFDGFRIQIGEELDLRNELRAMVDYGQLLHQVDLPLVKGFLMTAIRWGTFHGDVHAGNLLLMPDGRIGVIDWGIVGRLDRDSHFFFRRLCEAALGDDTAWKDIAELIIANHGQVIREGLKMNDEEITIFARATIEPVVTAPFGQVSLSALVNAPMEQVTTARGMELTDRSASGLFRRIREQRKLRDMAESHSGINSDFERGTFLLGKQLMYSERHGKMYLADKGIFSDRELFEKVLADSPVLAGRSRTD